MQNATLSISLIVGGAALTGMGMLRLARGWFRSMPTGTAVAVAVIGSGVVVFGAVLSRMPMGSDEEIGLEPQAPHMTPELAPATRVSGTVRTAGDGPVADAKVVLASPREGDLIVRSETESGPDGGFSFENVEIGGPYVVTTRFDGVDFESRSFLVPADPVEIRVAPTTAEGHALTVRASSLAVVGDEHGLQAVQAITLVNRDDRAFAGEVRLPLLPGATALQPTMGLSRSRLTVRNGVLASSAPVLPGESQITYTYVAPMQTNGLDFVNRFAYPTDRFDLLVGSGLLAGSEKPSATAGQVTLGDRTYRRLSWRDLESGDEVRAHIALRATASPLRWALVAVAVLGAAAIVLAPLARRRRKAP